MRCNILMHVNLLSYAAKRHKRVLTTGYKCTRHVVVNKTHLFYTDLQKTTVTMTYQKRQLQRAALLTFMAAISAGAMAQGKVTAADSTVTENAGKEEGNRNVMLNAASANGPREISIGLPGGDVNVLENGLPVVFNSNPHNVNTHWRGDGSLAHTGLLKISETAITTGNIGYAVNSFDQLGTDKTKFFNGTLNYNTNHFGKQQFDLNLNGAIGKGWFYSGSVHHALLS